MTPHAPGPGSRPDREALDEALFASGEPVAAAPLPEELMGALGEPEPGPPPGNILIHEAAPPGPAVCDSFPSHEVYNLTAPELAVEDGGEEDPSWSEAEMLPEQGGSVPPPPVTLAVNAGLTLAP